MATDEVYIGGLAELQKAMQELPAKIEQNMLRGAMRAGGKVIVEEAKTLAPVDDGDLKNSIRISTKSRNGIVKAEVKAGDKKAYYAHMIEFGTASYYAGTGRTVGKPYKIVSKKAKSLLFGGFFVEGVTHPGIRPQPFMRQAFDSSFDRATRAFAAYLENRMPKELAKNAPTSSAAVEA